MDNLHHNLLNIVTLQQRCVHRHVAPMAKFPSPSGPRTPKSGKKTQFIHIKLQQIHIIAFHSVIIYQGICGGANELAGACNSIGRERICETGEDGQLGWIWLEVQQTG